MGKGTNRAYKVVPVEDEPDFGDPPRNWARVASMAGAWALLLLGMAWMAPGFASGGGSDEVESLDEAAASPNNAARRYLRFGSNGDVEQANAALCEQASPQVTVDELVEIRDGYEAEMKSYPSVDPVTEDPEPSGNDFIVESTIIYDDGNSTREEQFSVTVSEFEVGRYCVSDVVRIETGTGNGPGTTADPKDLAAEFLSSMFVVRDFQEAASYQCDEYEGLKLQDLEDALSDWDSRFGEASAVQGFEGSPAVAGSQTIVSMTVELSSDPMVELLNFEVAMEDGCVMALSGGEALLDSAEE